jgi:hypothetical protein
MKTPVVEVIDEAAISDTAYNFDNIITGEEYKEVPSFHHKPESPAIFEKKKIKLIQTP